MLLLKTPIKKIELQRVLAGADEGHLPSDRNGMRDLVSGERSGLRRVETQYRVAI